MGLSLIHICAWQWRLEHADHNWNSFLTAPVPVGDLCLAKLIWAAVISLLSQAWIGVLFILSGKLVGLTGPIPPELPEWLLCGALGGVSVCAVQLYFSLIIRSFAPPVAFGLVGGIAGPVSYTHLGTMSMLFPPALVRCVPWGYYGLLSLVRMEWDPATRFTQFFWQWPQPMDLALLCLWAAVFLLVGRALFVRKEV